MFSTSLWCSGMSCIFGKCSMSAIFMYYSLSHIGSPQLNEGLSWCFSTSLWYSFISISSCKCSIPAHLSLMFEHFNHLRWVIYFSDCFYIFFVSPLLDNGPFWRSPSLSDVWALYPASVSVLSQWVGSNPGGVSNFHGVESSGKEVGISLCLSPIT